MKKKVLLPLLMSLLLAVSIAGCSSNAQDTASQKSTPASTGKAVADKAKISGDEQAENITSKPGSKGTAPTLKNETAPGAVTGTRIMGQIVSVKERTVTLALLERPSAPGRNGEQASAPPAASNPSAGETTPGKSGGPNQQLSGEKKTVTIPATVKIISGERDKSIEVSITDLKAGQILMIALNNSTNAIEEVRIMQEGPGGPPSGGGGPGQNSAASN